MSYTLRETSGFWLHLGVWALATILCAIAGPFGTHDAMAFLPRLAYWAGIVGLSDFGAVLSKGLSRERPTWAAIVIWSGYVFGLSSIVHLVNSVLFENWQGTAQFLYLLGIIAATVLVVHGAVALARKAFETDMPSPAVDAQAQFLRRIPLEKRGPLIRLEAQDHYLNVVTQKGSALILMRMQDAAEALENVDGLQVHRSHWVAQGAVAAHRRDRGRDFLVMQNGDDIPVSRSYRAVVQMAGLI